MYGTALEGLLHAAPLYALGFFAFVFLMFALGMQPPRSSAVDEKSKAVVLIDDDADVMRGLRSLIESRTPFRVAGVAYSGLEGVRVVEAVAPDLVVIDVKLPELDGIETARRIRASRPSLPIVSFSSIEDDATGAIMRRAGANSHLVKGDDADKIIQTILDHA